MTLDQGYRTVGALVGDLLLVLEFFGVFDSARAKKIEPCGCSLLSNRAKTAENKSFWKVSGGRYWD